MYKLVLILRYLRQKLAPMFAVLAVMLCTAMVIIVISVMGGFLTMMNQAAKALEGDISIDLGYIGFPHYEELLGELRKLESVKAGTAIIRGYGILSMKNPLTGSPSAQPVFVTGIVPEELDAIIDYRKTLHWDDPKLVAAGMTLTSELDGNPNDPRYDGPRGIVPGIAVSTANQRDEKGHYGEPVMPGHEVVLTLIRLSRAGAPVEQPMRRLMVVNEFKSGLHEVDASRVFVHRDMIQKALKMDRFEGKDAISGEPFVDPARVTEILVRGEPGVPLERLRAEVASVANPFFEKYGLFRPRIMTWREKHATFLGAVEKEKMMMTFLFGIISVVAVAMIGVIFYMIVLEKTRDIGVLRAIGASRGGVAGIFLGYGLVVGTVGAALGLGLAYLIVNNINEIQTWLTNVFGFTMWDPRVYYFDRIPAALNPNEVTVILIVAMLAGLIGALIPAWLASRLDPVEALRYE